MYDYVCYVASINSLVPKILTKNDENSLLCNITLNGIMTGLDTNQQHILFWRHLKHQPSSASLKIQKKARHVAEVGPMEDPSGCELW